MYNEEEIKACCCLVSICAVLYFLLSFFGMLLARCEREHFINNKRQKMGGNELDLAENHSVGINCHGGAAG